MNRARRREKPMKNPAQGIQGRRWKNSHGHTEAASCRGHVWKNHKNNCGRNPAPRFPGNPWPSLKWQGCRGRERNPSVAAHFFEADGPPGIWKKHRSGRRIKCHRETFRQWYDSESVRLRHPTGQSPLCGGPVVTWRRWFPRWRNCPSPSGWFPGRRAGRKEKNACRTAEPILPSGQCRYPCRLPSRRGWGFLFAQQSGAASPHHQWSVYRCYCLVSRGLFRQ